MRKIENNLILSATDLANHIHCNHLTELNKKAVNKELKKPSYENRLLEILQEKGKDFEKQYLTDLISKENKVYCIDIKKPHPFQNTIKAMEEGYDYIYQARLCDNNWQGWADFLIKVPTPSKLGNWSYEVIDTKLTSNTRIGTILQIAMYSDILEKIQGILPEHMHTITPEGKNSYRVADYLSYYSFTKKRFEKAIQTENLTYPEPCAHCDICDWWEHCNKIRRNDDHLTFVAGLGNSQRKELNSREINSLKDLAHLNYPVPFKPVRGKVETFNKLREQARVQLETRETNTLPVEFLDLEIGKGFELLPIPSNGDIYLDFEGDPMVEPNGLEYLFGWIYQNKYYPIWVMNNEEEKNAFEYFIDFVFECRSKNPDLHIYHFSPYEPAALKRMMGKYASKGIEIDALLRTETFVDLHRVVKQSLRLGVEKYSLKDLEKYFGFERKMELRLLSKVKANFEYLLNSKQFDAINEEEKKIIQLYNEEDCISTLELHKWLEAKRKELVDNGEIINRPTNEKEDISEKSNEFQERIKPIYDSLILDVPVNPEERTKEQQAKYLIANFLEFYKREEKVVWWEYFRLKALEPSELFDESAALTYLKYTGIQETIKRSVIDTYSFDKQECDIRIDSKIKDIEGKYVGEIVDLDLERGILKLKRGDKLKDYHPETIVKNEYISNDKKESRIIKFANWVITNGLESEKKKYKCIRDILLNKSSIPKDLNNDLIELEKAKFWASSLEGSFLAIQGPPGAGKSYTASRVILDLIKKGKRIGLTALSHKVIQNLLNSVYELNKEENFDLKIIQKPKSGNEEELPWDLDDITHSIAKKIEDYHLIAGTSFMWVDEELAEKVDYLFIDEAGQFSLIDTVAISHAATNLVLLGDNQQLQQPIKGHHPEGIEVSNLEHILEGHKTIPDNKGIFLGKTYRMHPEICAFDSEMFYESRLKSINGLENQSIEGNTDYKGSGLFYKYVKHIGNTNSSKEEVLEIEKIVNNLCKGDVFYMDATKNKNVVIKKDIKIITPYNSNVYELKQKISDVEIGTVDKFQGQEAPIIIYSIASSTPEDSPRGMDFLYSPNRFNVAVSRAKAIFILIGSPSIFEPDCKSIKEMKLANPFCRFIEVAKEII